MKIVIAMDSFKGTLSANQACEIIAEAIADAIAQEAGWAGGSPDVAALPRLHAGS